MYKYINIVIGFVLVFININSFAHQLDGLVCQEQQIPKYIASTWVCSSDNNDGDITGITAGTGLTGGGQQGRVNLEIKVPLVLQHVIRSNAAVITANNMSPRRNQVPGTLLPQVIQYQGMLGKNDSGVYGAYQKNKGMLGTKDAAVSGFVDTQRPDTSSYAGFFKGDVLITDGMLKFGDDYGMSHAPTVSTVESSQGHTSHGITTIRIACAQSHERPISGGHSGGIAVASHPDFYNDKHTWLLRIKPDGSNPVKGYAICYQGPIKFK